MIDPTLLGIAETHWRPRPSEKGAVGLYQIKAALNEWNAAHPTEQYTMDDMEKPSLGRKVSNWYVNDYVPGYMQRTGSEDTMRNRVGMYNAGPWGYRQRLHKVGPLANAPLESETTRLMDLYEGLHSFNPDSSGYWQSLADTMNIQPDATGHYPSREPRTGLILKGMKHPTIDLSRKADEEAGYAWTKSLSPHGHYYSVPVAPPDYYKNQ